MASSQKKKTNTKAEPARSRRKAAQPQPSRIPQRIAGAVVCMLIPIVTYILGTDQIVSGLTSGAVK